MNTKTVPDSLFEHRISYPDTDAQERLSRLVGLDSHSRLHRTSLPIPHAGGVYPPKPLPSILGGILTLESEWMPALGQPLRDALATDGPEDRLDLGCIAAHGTIALEEDGNYALAPQGKPATAFLFELIARLQASATVPMIDIRAYAKWLL